MEQVLSKFLNKQEQSLQKTQTPSKTKKVKSKDGLIEVVEKTILVEDGRQLLVD